MIARYPRRQARAIRSWLSFAALLIACWGAPLAVGRAEPPDVVAGSSAGQVGAIPELPPEFIRRQIGPVSWEFHPAAASLVARLMPQLPGAFRRIAADFGVRPDPTLTIRVVRGPREMRALAPRGLPPPQYAVGVAYPAAGLILLSTVAPGTWLPPDMAPVLTHELSHVILFRAVAGRPLPLWLNEGLAVVEAREQNLARIRTLWEAALAGTILPIAELSRHFPSEHHQVNLAYAQSADLVAHLLQRPEDEAALPVLIQRVAAGASFEQALLGAYRIDLPYLEREWRYSLRERFHVMPLLMSGTLVWVLIAVLAVLAFVRRRREHHAKLADWAEEEAAYERAMTALELRRRAGEREELARQEGLPLGAPPRDPALPTVEYEGEHFTLH